MLVPEQADRAKRLLYEAGQLVAREALSEADEAASAALHLVEGDRGELYQRALYRRCGVRRLMGQFGPAWVSGARLLHLQGEGGRSHAALCVLPDLIECGIHLALELSTLDSLISDVRRQAEELDSTWLRASTLLQESRVLRDRGMFELAASAAAAADELRRKSTGEGGYSSSAHLQAVALSLMDLGEYGDANRLYCQILDASDSHWGNLAGFMGLSRLAAARGRYENAAYLAENALGEAHAMYPLAVQYALEVSFDAALAQGDTEGARRIADELLFYAERTDSVRRRFRALQRAFRFNRDLGDSLAQLGSVLEFSQGRAP